MRTSEQRLIEALHAYEELAPDADAVAKAVYAGIATRRRRRRVTIAATSAVAFVAIVAMVGSVLTVGLPRIGRPEPASATPTPVTIGQWISTIEVGWIPDGIKWTSVESSALREHLYGSDAVTPNQDRFIVDVKVYRTWAPRLDLPGWQRLTINGQPAAKVSTWRQTILAFRLPSGRWATLEYSYYSSGPSGTVNRQPGLEEAAVRMAQSLREDRKVELRVAFVPTYLPAGQRVIGLGVDPGTGGSGTVICAAGPVRFTKVLPIAGHGYRDELPIFGQGPNVRIDVSPGHPDGHETPPAAAAERIPDIQGRPAYAWKKQRLVEVHDFHGGVLHVSAATDGATGDHDDVPLAELVKVAEGVRWIGTR